MKKIIIFYLSTFISICAIAQANEVFTPKEINWIVRLHNEKRAMVMPLAANMRMMYYSRDLATSAQNQASKCNWKLKKTAVLLRRYKKFGQNHYLTTGAWDLTNAIETWNHEMFDYNLTAGHCEKHCSNYTQMVNANTFKVGCGLHKCATMQNHSFTNAFFFVCHYHEQGVNVLINGTNVPPYITGMPCSKCPPEVPLCSKNLCNAHSGCSYRVERAALIHVVLPLFGVFCIEYYKKVNLDSLSFFYRFSLDYG